jgi:hypothetical protein
VSLCRHCDAGVRQLQRRDRPRAGPRPHLPERHCAGEGFQGVEDEWSKQSAICACCADLVHGNSTGADDELAMNPARQLCHLASSNGTWQSRCCPTSKERRPAQLPPTLRHTPRQTCPCLFVFRYRMGAASTARPPWCAPSPRTARSSQTPRRRWKVRAQLLMPVNLTPNIRSDGSCHLNSAAVCMVAGAWVTQAQTHGACLKQFVLASSRPARAAA